MDRADVQCGGRRPPLYGLPITHPIHEASEPPESRRAKAGVSSVGGDLDGKRFIILTCSRCLSFELRKFASVVRCASDRFMPLPSFDDQRLREFDSWLSVFRNWRQLEARPDSVSFLQ